MQRDENLLIDIAASAKRIVRFTANRTYDDFVQHEELQSAVIWQISVIGEAARRVSEGLKELYPEIPWFDMAGMRNRLIHDYSRIDYKQLWDTTQIDIPKLIKLIVPLIPAADRP